MRGATLEQNREIADALCSKLNHGVAPAEVMNLRSLMQESLAGELANGK